MKPALTHSSLEPYRQSGIAAASRALRRHNRTIAREAQRLGFEFAANNTATARERSQRQRASLAPVVIILSGLQISQERISAHLGITRAILRRIASEHHIDINSRSLG